jgi:hypothetical protein
MARRSRVSPDRLPLPLPQVDYLTKEAVKLGISISSLLGRIDVKNDGLPEYEQRVAIDADWFFRWKRRHPSFINF